MPTRQGRPQNISEYLASLDERVRTLEKHRHPKQEFPDPEAGENPTAYSWQSPVALVPMTGHKLFADRSGTIDFVRAERSSGDGTTTATFDVLKNGVSIFSSTFPSVAAGDMLGPEVLARRAAFVKGDYFEVEITDTGGGTGPLRVTIHFDGVLA